MQRKASYAAAYYKLLTSARSWRRESTPQHPAHTPSELFCGESSHRKVGSTRLAGLSPELILPQGCLGCRPPSGRWHLNWAGARPPTSLQEKIPPISSAGSAEPTLSQRSCQAAWQRREGSLEDAGFRAGPLPTPSCGRPGGEGSGPLPIAPGSGRDSAPRTPRRAPRPRPGPPGWSRQPAPP